MNVSIPPVSIFYAACLAFPLLLFAFPGLADGLSQDSLDGLAKAPWVTLALVAVLGWKLNQTRIFFAALGLLGAFWMLRQPESSSLFGLFGPSLAQAFAVALPLGVLGAMSLGESGMATQKSAARAALALLPLLLLAGMHGQAPEAFKQAMEWKALPVGGGLPQAGVLAWILLGAWVFFSRDAKLRPFLAPLLLALLCVLLGLESALSRRAASPQEHARLLLASWLAASALLAWAIFQMYWQRVYLDELTGIANRRALDEKLAALSPPYALAMVDIDHFKKFNDSYGHDEGDNVLRLVASHLDKESGGRAFRYGGEEFCLLFPGWDAARAASLCEEARKSLAGREFSIRLPGNIRGKTSPKDRGTLKAGSAKAQVTLSMGVSAPGEGRATPAEVVKHADQGLYQAKEGGRNRVVSGH